MKPKTNFTDAALGFRVKSGWAMVVLICGPVRSPELRDSRTIGLSDAKRPETRQPYHAAMGKLETSQAKIQSRLRSIRRAAEQSVKMLVDECQRNRWSVRRAGVVVGSVVDPNSIANPHIRAHALEGQLFRMALVNALRAWRIPSIVFVERDVYSVAAATLKKPAQEVERAIANLGRSTRGPWRAEQKIAALAGWLALYRSQ